MLKYKIVWCAVLLIGLTVGAGYYLVSTSRGARIVVDKGLEQIFENGESDFEQVKGSLLDGLVIDNLELKNIPKLPEGSVIRIQRITAHLTGLNVKALTVNVQNTRVVLPDSDPVVISGHLKDGLMDFNIYSQGFTVTELKEYFPDLKALIPLKGEASGVDLYISGDYREPNIKGNLIIENFMYKGFILTQSPLSIDVQLKDIDKDVQIYGLVKLEKGSFQTTKKVLVKLTPSVFKFSGLWSDPELNLHGVSKVGKTTIQIAIKGHLPEPDINLTSEPPASKEKLMIMLATGKSWESFDRALDGTLTSGDLTKDFIDYFIFAGRGNQFAQRYGVSEFSITFEETRQGISAKKELGDKIEVGYEAERVIDRSREGVETTQKLGGEYKVNENVSVGLEREIKQEFLDGLSDEVRDEAEDTIFIEYKKKF